MIEQLFRNIYDEKLAAGAIINDRMEGFLEDYLCLHILLKKHKIKSCFEIGCHVGFGTKIIKNCLGPDSEVYSLDLPDELSSVSKQHPLSENKIGVGVECDLPFTLFRGDSRFFDYSRYPCEAYWVDAEHTFENVRHETKEILKQSPKIVIFHDTDMSEVLQGALHGSAENDEYDFYRVTDTRIGYLLKK